NLAIGTMNNGGDLGKRLQQATSADSLKGYAIAAATAYLVSPQLDKAFGVSSDNINKVTKGFKLSTVEGIGGFAAYSIAQGFAQSVMHRPPMAAATSTTSVMPWQVRRATWEWR
ncbi:DUF637 domain-containing protein, partial [Pseudomonas aeruginosa]|uniref:DUF637 domain-containing protein n=1 Tax=Pseudomonas aeruginosa TaxID=287 RepID=UPI0037486CB7